MPDFPERVGEWLLDLVGFLGLGLSGPGAAATPWLDALRQDAYNEDPNLRLTPAQLAEQVVKGIATQDTAADEAKFSGLSWSRFDALVRMTGNPPGPGDLVDMLRRGIIGGDDFATGIRQGYVKTEWSDKIAQLRWLPLPVDDAVRGVVQNHVDIATAHDAARQHGVTEPDFAVMVENAGNPPGPQEILDLWNRGAVDEPTVDQAFRESRLKNKYIDALKQLRRRLLTVGEAVEAAVQGHLDNDTAARAAAMQGVDRTDFDVLYETAGNPPGAMDALDLWRRGDIDEATVDQMLRESRLKNKYIEILKKRSRRLVPMRTITTLLSHGAVTDARALEMLRQLGFTPADGQAIVDASHFAKTQPDKQLTVTQVRDLYTSQMISKDQAVADLAAIHYPPAVATQILDLADREISRRDRTSVITKVRNAYLARRIDRQNASGDLDVIGVEATQRDRLLDLWDLELGDAVAMLTPAQIVHAGKLGIFTTDVMLARLVGHGYSDDDAVTLAMLGGALPVPSPST